VGLNGEKETTDAEPPLVSVKGLLLLSINRFDWQVKSTVLATLVKGDVGVVATASAVELTRTFDR
jgi:hypothetical protein